MHTVVSVKKPVGGCGSGGETVRNGSTRRRARSESEPAGGSLCWGSSATAISLLAMPEPPQGLRGPGRVGDRVLHDGTGHDGHRRGWTLTLETARMQLADEGLGAVDVRIGVEAEERECVDGRAHGLTRIAPVNRQPDGMGGPAVDDDGLQSTGDQRAGLDRSAR